MPHYTQFIALTSAPIKETLTRKTCDDWISSDELKSTLSYKITSGRPKGTANLSREEEVIINQLRTGKSALSRKCLTRYKGMSPEHAKCIECGEEETVEHLLTCPVKEGIRRSIMDDRDPLEVLNVEPRMILDYLERTGRRTAPDLQRRD